MKIELTSEQLKIIDEALKQLPYNIAAPIIDHINKQKNAESVVFGTVGRGPLLPEGYATLAIDISKIQQGRCEVPAIWKVKSDPCLMVY